MVLAPEGGEPDRVPSGRDGEQLFFAEDTRTVKADNTFAFAGKRFEAPRDLRNKKIHIRFDPARRNQHGKVKAPRQLPVYLNGTRLGEASRLDPFANDRAPTT